MEKSKKKFFLATLGCRTNQYESQALLDQLLSAGFERAREGERADLCIINTCTVTDGADRSSRNIIRRAIRENRGARVVVTGCLPAADAEAVKAIPGVTDVIGMTDKERLLELIYPESEFPEFAIRSFVGHTRAFIKVQDGCNSFCSYCIVPYVRGRSRSRSLDSILKEVDALVANGYQEVVITGINVGDYDGGNGDGSLAALVRAIDRVPGIRRIRLSSIDPHDITEDLREAILSGKHTCHCLHLVLQSGSNLILKKMNRRYTRQDYFAAVAPFKVADPDFTFTTDIIVGFPGETDGQFNETLEVIQQMEFAKVHIFPYSARSRTRAASYPKVADSVITARKTHASAVAESVAAKMRQRYVGKRLEILTENSPGEGVSVGHTMNFIHVTVNGGSLPPNTFVQVQCTANGPEGLIGQAPTQSGDFHAH